MTSGTGPSAGRTSYARAAAGYDDDFQQRLTAEITRAIFDASKVTDVDLVAIRTGETAAALVSTLAMVLALSPEAARSPTAIRKTIDELGKRLRRHVAAASASSEFQEFARRCFRNWGGGHA